MSAIENDAETGADKVPEEDPAKKMTPLEQMVQKVDVAEFMLTMLKRLKVDCGFRSTKMANAPWDYYCWDLQKRADFLSAPSLEYLTKTMIMENHFHREENASDPHYPRHILVIVQYCRTINQTKVTRALQKYQNSFYPGDKTKQVGGKGFKYRMAEDQVMADLSGYRFNAVTPFFMTNEKLPVLLDQSIVDLEPSYFWMGGGRVSLKLGMSVSDVKAYFGDRLIVDYISDPKK